MIGLGFHLGLGANLRPPGSGSGGSTTNTGWVFYYGAYNDAGAWDDNSLWQDVFAPAKLFFGTTEGVWFDGTDRDSVFQDTAGQTAVVNDADPVALIRDKSGRGHDAVQSVSANQGAWDNGIVPNAVLLDSVGVTHSDSEARFPVPDLPNREYNVFMTLKLARRSQAGYRGLFATNTDVGNDMMLLLRTSSSSNFGTYGPGGDQLSTISLLAQGPEQDEEGPWLLAAMHENTYRFNGAAAGTYTNTQGQHAGIGGIGSQVSGFYLGDLVAIDRALSSVEQTLLERYMADKHTDITLS